MSELAKRVRAARAYKAQNFTQQQLADATGLDVQLIKRMEKGVRDPKTPEQWAIAEVCGLPREFFTADFEQLAALRVLPRDTVHAGVEFMRDLRAKIQATVDDVLAGLSDEQRAEAFARIDDREREQAAATRPTGGAPPQPPGELGRRATGAEPTPERHERPASASGAARRGGTG